MNKDHNVECIKEALSNSKKSATYFDERVDTMIKSPSDIKWTKKGKKYVTNIDKLEDFLYTMYLIYQASEKAKREILIDVKLCKKKKTIKNK